MLVLLFVALWFVLLGDLYLPCVIFLSCVLDLLALRLLRLGKRELILDLSVFFFFFFFLSFFRFAFVIFICFLFLFVSENGCDFGCGTPWTVLLPC